MAQEAMNDVSFMLLRTAHLQSQNNILTELKRQ
jgi:hypothetical protein